MNFEASRETYNLVTAAQTDYNLQLKYDETEHSWLCLAWWISISSPATEETTTMVIILISLTPHTSHLTPHTSPSSLSWEKYFKQELF